MMQLTDKWSYKSATIGEYYHGSRRCCGCG